MDYLGNVFFMMRHGEATHNVEGYIASEDIEKTDRQPKLTERGREQAEFAALELVGKKIDVIYSSPYKRTTETASIIAERLGLEVEFDARLGEVDLGILDGKPIEEYREYFKNRMEKLTKPIKDGETLTDVRGRAGTFLKDILSRHKDDNILIVSHGDVLWMMESIFLDIQDDGISNVYHNTGELIRFPYLKTE